MRGSSLQAVRARVDRLATQLRTDACNGHHQRVRFAYDDTVTWPPADAPERCDCGAELSYVLVRFHYV